MFQSIGRRGNYANAGRVAADDLVRSFAAARRNSTDFGKIAEGAAAIRSNEKVAAIRRGTEVMKAGINAASDVKSAEQKIKINETVRSGKRKAGALAAAGQMIGNAGQYFGEKRTKREVGSEDSMHDAQITKATTKAAELRSQAEEVDLTGGFTPMKVPHLSTLTNTSKTSDTTKPTGTTPTTGSPSSGTDGWSKLSKVIRYGEGTSGDAGYTTQFTGSQFTDLSRHPRQMKSGGGYKSDAAGAYQFLSTTWDEAKSALGLKDFSPASQEAAGKYLAQRRGVDTSKVYTNIDDFTKAINKLAPEWASLPYQGVSPSGHGKGSSYYGQGGIDINKAWELYNS